MKQNRLFVALCAMMLTAGVMAQTKKYAEGYDGEVMVIEGKVIDKVTRKPLPVNVKFRGSDGTIINEGALSEQGNFSMNIPKDSVVMVEFYMIGYEPNLLIWDYRDEKSVKLKNLGYIEMVEKPLELDEVTVKASKVKMVYRGDTIVYNADAFRLSDGSMLDALIEQLPGVELKGNQILVNGRYVESLLVNGKDFFRGDPSVALQNLPAYMVNKVKVYEKEHEDAHVIGNLKEKPLVVDVNLKNDMY